jgi:putative ABC transport system permease protein
MNLSTARSAQRMREVGLRKVVGATRGQLILQFMGEPMLLSLFGLLVAGLLVEAALPSFNGLIYRRLVFLGAADPGIIVGLLVITIMTGGIAGSYPALFLSSFLPVDTVKGTLKTGRASRIFRQILVTGQFAVSIILIVSAIVVYKQADYMQQKPLGYDKENLIVIGMNPTLRKGYAVLKNEWGQNPNVINVTAVMNLPVWQGPSYSLSDWEGRVGDEKIMIAPLS